MGLLISESYVNATKGWRCGDSGVYESAYDNPGQLFKALQKEYGRCVSKVYVDGTNNKPKAIGWVFQKRQQYERSNEWFVSEVWITLHRPRDYRTL